MQTADTPAASSIDAVRAPGRGFRPGRFDMTDAAPSARVPLLLYIQVPFYRNGGLWVEKQAANGLRLWVENFGSVAVMAPVVDGTPPAGWIPERDLGPVRDRLEVHPLPTAYHPGKFLKHYPSTRRRIRDLIGRCDYPVFAIGGLFGDWGAVASLEARRLGRPYAVWTDKVESEVLRRSPAPRSLVRRLYRFGVFHAMTRLERTVIGSAAVGLFHGADTFSAYAAHCPNPHLVHDIHIGKGDHIPPEALARKLETLADGPLRIVYAGRASPEKGPADWIAILAELGRRNPEFRAEWLGDGPSLAAMKDEAAVAGIADRVTFAGFVDDRQRVLAALRAAHVLLFCHLTPESPRILIEALLSATPIVGYGSSYSEDLIHLHRGGLLRPIGDRAGLAEALGDLAGDRAALRDLTERAHRDGSQYDDETVFRHRSDLIKDAIPGPLSAGH